MNIHFIQHEVFEAPGAYLDWAVQRNYNITISKVYEFDVLPQTPNDIDLLIVMGGPQSPATSMEECPHFDAQAEMSLILKCMEASKAVVGVCLGAQLIGEALGAKHTQSPEKEIGVFPIELTAEGLQDDKIVHFGTTLQVGHWHNDMPGLTAEAKVLAQSVGCPRQIVAYADLVYGFQCHMEFTAEVIELLIAEEEAFLSNNTAHQYVQKPSEIRNHSFEEMNQQLYIFLDALVKTYEEQHQRTNSLRQ